jgi:hypothetical protein
VISSMPVSMVMRALTMRVLLRCVCVLAAHMIVRVS